MKRIINKSMKHINSNDDRDRIYSILASVVMYHVKPLVDEKWNTFPSKKIDISEELKLTHEQKNPDVYKHISKEDLQRIMNKIKYDIIKKYPNLDDYCTQCGKKHDDNTVVKSIDLMDGFNTRYFCSLKCLGHTELNQLNKNKRLIKCIQYD